MSSTLESPPAPGPDSSPATREPETVIGAAFFGMASVLLCMACFVWPAGGLWGPGVSMLIAWLLFGVHLLLIGRRLGAFDPLIWIPVLVLLHYFGMPLAIEVFRVEHFTYDGFGVGIPPKLQLGFALALLAHASLLFGYHLGGVVDLSGAPAPPSPGEPAILGPAVVLVLGGLAMSMLGIVIAGPQLVFGGYGDLKYAEIFGLADLRFFNTGMLFALGGTFGVLASLVRGRNTLLLFALASAGLLLVLLTLTGDRTGMSVLIIGCGWALTQRIARVPRWFAVAGFVAALVVMPVIKEFRVYRNVEDAQQRSAKDQIALTVYEMGTSAMSFCYTVDKIPSEKPYSWGLTAVSAVLAQIPNLGTTTGFYLGFGLDHDPSAWLTLTANPNKFFHSGGGHASTLGAEWYFNFGMLGVLFGMAATGFLGGQVRNRSRRSPMWLAFSCLWLGMMLAIVRNDMGFPFRTMLWPMIGYGALLGLRNVIFGRRYTTLETPESYDPRDRELPAR